MELLGTAHSGMSHSEIPKQMLTENSSAEKSSTTDLKDIELPAAAKPDILEARNSSLYEALWTNLI